MVPEPGLNPADSADALPPAPGSYGPASSAYPPSQLPAPGPQQLPPGYGGQWPDPGQPVYWQTAPPKPTPLPITAREYHEFFRTPRYRWWKPLLSLLMFAATWIVANIVFGFAAIFYDWSTGRVKPSDTLAGNIVMTPALFTANNLALAASIPLAGLTAWAVFGQRPRWISSIAGGFRWGLFLRFVAVAVPILLVSFGVEVWLGGGLELVWNNDSWFLIVAILLTTPFQAAGEEYGVRGILARSVGSWFGSRRVGLVVATFATSVVFMLLHGAGEPWLNGYYFGFGVVSSILVWKTGGLEAGIAMHVVNNLVGEITLPFGGLDTMFERGAGTAGPEILFQVFFTLLLAAGLLLVSRRLRIPQSAAPGAQQPETWR